MTKTIIKPAGAAPAAGPYNHGVRIGDLLFCAGQIATVPETGQLLAGDIKAQTQRVLENIKLILQDQGLTAAALSGEGGGKLRGIADPLIMVPSRETARIQEMHILLGHILCTEVEHQLGLA